MKTFFLLCSILLVSKAYSQSVLEKEIKSYVDKHIPKEDNLTIEIYTGNCTLLDRKEVEVMFHWKKLTFRQPAPFLYLAATVSSQIHQNILKHHPEVDCLTMSELTDGQGEKQKITFYVIGENLRFEREGRATINYGVVED